MYKTQEKHRSADEKRLVLIVDDELINRELLKLVLEDDYNTLTAADGESALEIIRQQSDHLSLIMLDLLMPGMHGLEGAAADFRASLRQRLPHRHVRPQPDRDLQAAADRIRACPDELLLEITESAYTQDSAQIISKVNHLRDLGFRIEMDDFGTGCSSLNMISTLPIDALKLDMTFIRNAFKRGGDTRLIEVIIDIADYLSVPVIAEGVETAEQLNALKAMGCDLVQGYYFSKPVPAGEFEAFLADKKRRMREEGKRTVDEWLEQEIRTEDRSMPASITRALSSGFEVIYYVDTQSGRYVEFSAQGKYDQLKIERSGSDFFADCQANILRVVHPDDYKKVQASIAAQIADTGNSNLHYVEYRIIRRDGVVRWVDDYGHFTHLPGYGDVYYVFIGDITEKHNVLEDTHRRSMVYEGMLEQFNALADESLTVFRTNISTGVIEEVRGRDLYDEDHPGGSIAASAKVRSQSFLVPGDSERYDKIFALEKLVARYYNGEGPAVFVGYCKRKSGRQCFVKFSGSAAIDPVTGDVIAFGVETEYNTQKVTEVLNQRVLAQQYDMVAYIVGDHYGVVIGDAANIRRGNIFPRQRDGVYSEYINRQVIPASSPSVHDPEQLRLALSAETVVEKLEKKDTYTVDVTCEENGELFFKRFTYYLVDREAKFYLVLKSDITDVLRQERERNTALADALKAAEQANAAKTAFLSNMSHEIRPPLNAIIGLDNIAMQDPDVSSRMRDHLEKIGESARHLLTLINDILDMSRIESGRLTLRKEEFSFSGMLEQITTMVQAQCRDKGLNFECRIIGQVADNYIGDDMKLKQVIINILSNAIKFTDAPGSVLLMIERVARFDNNSTLRFVIKDTGIGMDESFLPKVFDAFSQENSTRSSKFGSTGLGMAITKNIVEMMNGTISVSSKKGQGTVFIVTVTLRDSEIKTNAGSIINPREMRVLIVDDDPIACEHARIVLEEVGIASDTCLNGREALKFIELRHAKHEPYHLVLLDWKMPEQDGVDVAREIRSHYNHETTIIILTAYNWDDIADIAVEAGIDSFISKPLFASSVLDEYEMVMKRKNLRAEQKKRKTELNGKRVLMAEDVQRSLQAGMTAHLSKPVEPDHLYETLEALIW